MAKESESRDPGDLVAIAKIVKPKGLKGEVFADLLTDFPGRFENLDSVIVNDSKIRELKITRFGFHKNRVILKFQGFDTIESVEPLRGLELCVAEEDAVELEEGEFFDWELEGCRIKTADGKPLGIVKEIFRAGENVNLVVIDDELEYMIPFVEAICTDVDIEGKQILVDLPEGLREL